MPAFPPLDGSLLFADLVNFHIERNGSQPIYVYATDAHSGCTEITFLEFGRAAHRLAHALRPSRHGEEGQIVMLIATIDILLYQALVTGMLVAGLVPFLVSPRNSPAAIIDMMRKTGCSRILTLRNSHQTLMDSIEREASTLKFIVDELPTLSYAFPNLGCERETDDFNPYPPPASRPHLDSPAIYLHSSGSTGFPKPIPYTHKIQMRWMSQPPTLGYRDMPGPVRLGVMSLPSFHIYGLMMQLHVPFACLVTAALYPPVSMANSNSLPVVPTTDNILETARLTKCTVLMCIPAFLEQWATSSEAVNQLKLFDLVAFGGGPLSVKVGNALSSAGVPIVTGYGATECGIITSIPSRQDIADGDWLWLRIADGIDVRWVPEGDDMYECHILSTDGYPLAVENLPDVKGLATSDLFIKHPTKDMWRIMGRKDDVIVLASGEKTVPAPMESIIGSSPLIQGVVVFGQQRNQVGVLVEQQEANRIDVRNEQTLQEFRDRIWPFVEEANATAPAFSRIFKDMILVTHSGKPFARTAKGSVQRKVVLKDYESEIDALYETSGSSSASPSQIRLPSSWNSKVLSRWLNEHACTISGGRNIDSSVDLFAQGFDSLSATYLRNQILAALQGSSDPDVRRVARRLPANIVFANPTIELLSNQIAALLDQDTLHHSKDSVEQRKAAMEAMIEKYSVGLSGNPRGIVANGVCDYEMMPSRAVVLLTGSTGGLGSFLLAQLLEDCRVEKVYAFNRPSASASIDDRQRSAFSDKGLPLDLLNSQKLCYIEADASEDNCGLSSSAHDEIRKSVTIIIHNAWRLDFNLSLSSFEPHIRATRNLVDLGLNSAHHESLRFAFTSSIGSAFSWDRSKGLYPEEVLVDPSYAVGAGYGESKYVAERIIVKSGLRATSLRIGQIAGGSDGSWATTDWVPILVKSSIALGALPEAQGFTSWLRAEEVTAAILEIAFARTAPPPALNIVNPRGTLWSDIFSSVRQALVEERGLRDDDIPMVPFSEWLDRLEKRAEGVSTDDAVQVPAIKLLEYFRVMEEGNRLSCIKGCAKPEIMEACGMVKFDTSKAQHVSRTMSQMRPIGEKEARSWVRYWSSKEFL